MKSLYSWVCLMLLTLACQTSALAPMKEAATEQVPATPTEPTQVRSVRMVCADGLNFRDAPMGEIKYQAERGERVWVLEPVNGWSEIASGKWQGLYVKESWLCE